MATLSKCTVTLPPNHSDGDLAILHAVLARHVAHGWEEQSLPTGDLRFVIHCTKDSYRDALSEALHRALPDLDIAGETVEEVNWLESWKEFFTPVEGGSHFLVLAPWMTKERAATLRIPIIIEPKTAFGTGHHASTALCLDALSRFACEGRLQKGMRFLDIGTGTGILAIACAKLGLGGDCLDIDPAAVDNARENRDTNAVAATDCRISQGSVEQAAGPYDIVLANILAAPLRDLAPQVAALSRASTGKRPLLVLSGILDIQADAVEEAYRDQGFGKARRLRKEEWTALLFG